MKTLTRLATVCVFGSALVVQGATGATGAGPFFNFDVGLGLMQDLKHIEGAGIVDLANALGAPGPVTSAKAEFVFDPGLRFDISGGYNFNEAIAIGLETGLIYNYVDELKLTAAGPGGESQLEGGRHVSASSLGLDLDFYQIPILANVIFTLPLRAPCRFYLGGGAGGVLSIFDGTFQGGDLSTQHAFTFAYEGLAGVSFTVAPRMDVGVGYKFLGTTKHTFEDFRTGETYSHSILATFDFRF